MSLLKAKRTYDAKQLKALNKVEQLSTYLWIETVILPRLTPVDVQLPYALAGSGQATELLLGWSCVHLIG